VAKKRRQQSEDGDALGVVAAGLLGLAGLYSMSEAEDLRKGLARAQEYGQRLLAIRNNERAAFLRLQDESRMFQQQLALLNEQQKMLLREKQELEAELQKCRRDNEKLRETVNEQKDKGK
jgi:hypothetical protein